MGNHPLTTRPQGSKPDSFWAEAGCVAFAGALAMFWKQTNPTG